MDAVNVLFIVCDTLRADHVGCYGYFRDTSPNIDRVAAEGVLFEDFYNSGCPTGPAYTCMYTGLYPIHHKFYAFVPPNAPSMSDEIFTLPEIMQARGYTTAALDNLMNFPAHPKHFVRGYEFYINANRDPFMSPPQIRAEQVNRRLIPWIRDHSEERFFLFVHYWDPHLPYLQPEEYRRVFHHEKGTLSDLRVEEAPGGYKYVPGWGRVGEFADGETEFRAQGVSIDLYDGEIRYMDHAIGEVFEALKDEGVFDETLILVTSDHGEQLGQHGAWGHNALHDAVTHIPLIMRYPKRLPKGRKVRGFGQHIDLLPTILELTGAPPEVPGIDGQSLLPLLKDKPIRDRIFMEQVGLQRAIRTGEWKLIHFIERGTYELYNVARDPVEAVNLEGKEEKEGQMLKGALEEWVKTNLREGEEDPMFASRRDRRLGLGRMEYQRRALELLEALGLESPYIRRAEGAPRRAPRRRRRP